MCVLAFAWAAHPRWQLVMIGNRDELHARPAAALERWGDHPHVIAGRDLEAGGTWLGVSEEGRFAVVTNVANLAGPQPDKASRGALIADILIGRGRYAAPESGDLDDFNPFNIIAVDSGKAQLLSNRPGAVKRTLGPGIYGLSNSMFEDNWAKTDRIKALLGDWLDADSESDGHLFDALRADDAPQVPPIRAQHSPIFIRNPRYGTRCSTMVAIDHAGCGWISERRYNAEGGKTGQTRMAIDWSASATG
ncbi:NRDE family protein [Parasphingopyxis lamellibrachiae]|uniref:Uncharacterized protein with NRDE domain n=1 Tax=Parasphingopyxis lamellibrachiae TaxID=680125 RepID=A0A3D9FDH6_9SPHN|nr:NRDE family protein [Parasphingopyxis lamellibrachiae]RED15718.1 uncharacterized protein with NRDE domain [Parasphingopyxis lamellibrachiae]